MTPTSPQADRVYLTDADVHELFTAPPVADYPVWLVGLTWIAVLFLSLLWTGLLGYGLYKLVH